MASPPRLWFQRALLATLAAVLLLIAKDWAYAPTFRRYWTSRAPRAVPIRFNSFAWRAIGWSR